MEIGTGPRNSFSGNICFEFRYCFFAVWTMLCSVYYLACNILNIYVQRTHKHLLAERSYRNKRQEIEFVSAHEKKSDKNYFNRFSECLFSVS